MLVTHSKICRSHAEEGNHIVPLNVCCDCCKHPGKNLRGCRYWQDIFDRSAATRKGLDEIRAERDLNELRLWRRVGERLVLNGNRTLAGMIQDPTCFYCGYGIDNPHGEDCPWKRIKELVDGKEETH